MRSTISSVSRIPAVSKTWTGIPPTTSCDSTTSRVVPGRSVTIARSLWLQAFNRLDFPTFGRPTIATLSPDLNNSPRSAVASIWVTCSITASMLDTIRSSYSGGKSSAKSIRASTSAKISSAMPRNSRIGCANFPWIPARAVVAACADFDPTKSAMLSA